jgi:hypothetical protein
MELSTGKSEETSEYDEKTVASSKVSTLLINRNRF